MTRLLRLVLRRHRIRLLAWIVPLTVLMAVTPPQYAGVYPELADRQVLVEQMQTNKATELLYGPLPSPGTIGQLAQWETGAYLMILAALMAVLLAVALTRADEDAGTLEVVRACGLPARAPLVVAMTVVIGACLALGTATGVILGLESSSVAELTWSGSLTFGAVLTLSSATLGMTALALAQLPHDSHAARRLGLAALGTVFAVRAVADAIDQEWLRWFSPLGWKDIVSPFTRDSVWPLPVFLAVAVLCGTAAVALDARRELGGGLAPTRPARVRHAHVRTPFGLSWMLSRGSVTAWTLSLLALAALFGAMTRSLQEIITNDENTQDMMAQMTGLADPLVGFLSYLGNVVGLLVGVFAVGSVLAAHRREERGLLDVELSTGPRRWTPLLAQSVTSAVAAAVMLVLTGVVLGGIAASQVPGHHAFERSFAYVAGNAPGIVALVGIAALVVAWLPRHASLAWVPAIVSPVLTVFGQLLELPHWLIRLSVLGHVSDVTAGPFDWTPLIVMLAVGVTALLLSTGRMRRRDILTA